MKIKFIATTEEAFRDFPYPDSSNKFIPEWYKEMPSVINGKEKICDDRNGNYTVKKCVPFRDSMFSGYIIPIPFDVYIERDGNKIVANCSYYGEYQLIAEHRIEQYFMYPIPEGYDIVALKWNNPWIVKTPKNWSTLFTQPMHRDLPFHVMSGLVDTDKHPVPVSFIFFIKKDFQGIIKKGTPMVQCIPIKRQNFIGYVLDKIDHLWFDWRKATTIVSDRYKTFFHTPKSYKMEKEKNSKCPFSNLFK